MIGTIALLCAILGIALILLGAVRPTATHVPGGITAGIVLLLTGVVLWVLLTAGALTT